jgi:hypothetical protein
MSALGQKQTSDWRPLMSALPPKADIVQQLAMFALSQKRTLVQFGIRKASPLAVKLNCKRRHSRRKSCNYGSSPKLSGASTCSVGRLNSAMHFAPINPITANRINSPTSRGSAT